jgi:hypothetical protein
MLLLIPVLIALQQPTITTCVITQVKPTVTAVCQDKRTFTIDNFADDANAEWHWRQVVHYPERIDSWTQVVVDKEPAVGRVLKLSRDGKPVAPCEVRKQRKLSEFQRDKSGQIAPMSYSELPADCGGEAEFVKRIMEPLKGERQ